MKHQIKILMFILSVPIVASSDDRAYVIIKKGDTISDVLYAKNVEPIYGPRGAMNEILKLNKRLRARQGHHVYVGEKIYIGNVIPRTETTLATTSSVTRTAPMEIFVESKKQKKNPVLAPVVSIPSRKIAETTDTDQDDFNQTFSWKFSPSLSWKALSSSDSNNTQSAEISALSDAAYGLNFNYIMNFDSNIQVAAGLLLEASKFSQDPTIQLKEKSFFTKNFSFGISAYHKWLFDFSMTDCFYLTSPNSTTVEIKTVAQPEFKTSYEHNFYQFKKAKIAGVFSGAIVFPRPSSELETNMGYGAGASVEARLRNQVFSMGYDLRLLKAKTNSTQSQNIFWKYSWETL